MLPFLGLVHNSTFREKERGQNNKVTATAAAACQTWNLERGRESATAAAKFLTMRQTLGKGKLGRKNAHLDNENILPLSRHSLYDLPNLLSYEVSLVGWSRNAAHKCWQQAARVCRISLLLIDLV